MSNRKSFIPYGKQTIDKNDLDSVLETLQSEFLTQGPKIPEFEKIISDYCGAKYVVAVSNATAGLHLAALALLNKGDKVLTSPNSFLSTSNAIIYAQAQPIFIDVDKDTMGLSPSALGSFLKNNTIIKNKQCINKKTNKVIKACIPMHTYGHSCKIDEIKKILEKYFIFLIEDSAESLGSLYKDKQTGTFGHLGIISFNGNKIITAGGGGCIITNDEVLAKKAKHLTTTAKLPHKWNFNHDMVGYNYRMPNLNAALLVAQLENLDKFISSKRILANAYEAFFNSTNYVFVKEPMESKSNYWLNSILLKNKQQRDEFLNETNSKNVMTRPIWTLMNKLSMFEQAQCGDLTNSEWLEERLVNIPSSVL